MHFHIHFRLITDDICSLADGTPIEIVTAILFFLKMPNYMSIFVHRGQIVQVLHLSVPH